MQEKLQARGPSDATLARRDAKIVLAPFVANLSSWHQQAARLLLEVDRAELKGEAHEMPSAAVQDLIDTIRRQREEFADKTASISSSRVVDVERSFSRLLSDLQRAEARCGGSPTR
jgi:hypothetical protein